MDVKVSPYDDLITRRGFVAGLSSVAACSVCAASGNAGSKAIVFNIGKLSTHDGPGFRTVVFFKGCPLRCVWCHSPESWSYNIEKYPSGEVIGREVTVESLLEEVLKDKDFYDASGGGVTVSGGEPLAHPDFLRDFFREAKKAGLHTAIETSGFASSAVIDGLLPHVDLWLYDIKLLDPEACMKLTARPLAPVLGNLRRINAKLASAGKGGIVLRCPMIPGLNDGVEELRGRGALADELDAVERLDVISYVPYGIDKAKRLGLKVYEAPRLPVGYGEEKVRELARYTRKRVCVG